MNILQLKKVALHSEKTAIYMPYFKMVVNDKQN